MKKLLFVLAIVGLMTACKSKKADEKKPDETTTNTTAPATAEPTTTTTTAGVPTFSDPEIQKFANDYAAFLAEYKAGMKDPVKLAALTKTMKEWSSKGQSIGMKLATRPDEARAWAEWWLAISKDLIPVARQ